MYSGYYQGAIYNKGPGLSLIHILCIRDRACAGVAGSLTNTLLVMNMIYLFFGSSYAIASNKAVEGFYAVILGVICTSGIPEAIVAGILTTAIAKVLLRVVK